MPTEPIFCPICSHKLTSREDGGRLRPACDNCGYIHYVNPVPGVGILIEMDGGIVLVQRGHPPNKDAWALPSGFIEADESAEEAAVREAYEETGLKIELTEMMGVNSFPEGPPVSGVMIFYRARPLTDQLQAGDDAVDVRVFQLDEIPRMPFRTHREIMAEWQALQSTPDSERLNQKVSPEFIIRRAKPTDIDEILGLVALIPANRNFDEDDWREVIFRLKEGLSYEVYVAQSSAKQPLIIGFVVLSIMRGLTENRGWINDMAVLPTYQRQGVGAGLMDAVIRRADELNLVTIMVNPQRANEQARAFYAAAGFSDFNALHLKIRKGMT